MPMEVTAYWDGDMQVRIPVRDFEVRSDEPPQYGGEDTAPMPTELFLSSLAASWPCATWPERTASSRPISPFAPWERTRASGSGRSGSKFGRPSLECRT
jgi:hypothetical protein